MKKGTPNFSSGSRLLEVLRFSACYFGIVFGCGFVLGPVRVLLLEPHLGTRWAELVEMPLMLTLIVLAARWLTRRQTQHWTSGHRLAAGLLSMIAVLSADTLVGTLLRGMSMAEVFTARDPVSGTAYYLTVLMFGIAPWWTGRKLSSYRSP